MGRNGSLERAREFTVLGPRVKTGRTANFVTQRIYFARNHVLMAIDGVPRKKAY